MSNQVLKSPLSKSIKIALIQLKAGADKAANLTKVTKFIDDAVTKSTGVNLVMLPECFNSPYAVDQFRNYAEDIPREKLLNCCQVWHKNIKYTL